MFIGWLRTNPGASLLLLLIRLYVGWEWVTGGWEKLSEGFSAASFLKSAVEKPIVSHDQINYPIYHSFLQYVALPNAEIFSFLVSWGELLVGLGLILGCMTTMAAFFGVLMNFSFLLAGTISTNPWMILITIFILFAGRNAGKFGVDYYFIPYVQQWFKNNKE